MPRTGRRPREDAHQQIATDGPTAVLPGTEMTVLFLKRVKRRPSGTEMKFLFLRRVKREAARNRNEVFVLGEGKKETARNRNDGFVPKEGKKGGCLEQK